MRYRLAILLAAVGLAMGGSGALFGAVAPAASGTLRKKYGTSQCPWIFDIQMWLMGIAGGSTAFHLESAHQWSKEARGAGCPK
jgi:hypothetical protein